MFYNWFFTWLDKFNTYRIVHRAALRGRPYVIQYWSFGWDDMRSINNFDAAVGRQGPPAIYATIEEAEHDLMKYFKSIEPQAPEDTVVKVFKRPVPQHVIDTEMRKHDLQ
jgi:hypothetical protein